MIIWCSLKFETCASSQSNYQFCSIGWPGSGHMKDRLTKINKLANEKMVQHSFFSISTLLRNYNYIIQAMSSIRRHLPSECGPVPITPAMDPDFQAIARAGNQGVHERISTGKRKRTVKAKRFAWDDEDRFRLGKMAHELKSNKAALAEAKLIFPGPTESTIRSFKKTYLIAIKFNPALEAVQRAALKKKRGVNQSNSENTMLKLSPT